MGVDVTSEPDMGNTASDPAFPAVSTADRYVVLSWNDLGMHCYNPDFRDLAVLPPYNNLWAQVVRVGDPPVLMTSTVTVTYSFPDNTSSVNKSNFWTYAPALFGVNLAPNVGLAGKGLAGDMDPKGDHFMAEGIPLTEYSDSAPTVRNPYQLATVIAYDQASGQELARTITVAPVSTEMRCDNCHKDGGVEGIATGRVDTNILTFHDQENQGDYPPGHQTALMNRRPVLCAECHASNALGAPGLPGVPSLSNAIHRKHAEEAGIPNTTEGCYNCHPGPTTQCLRDVMTQKQEVSGCPECHGSLAQVGQNASPWLSEPKCDTCHSQGQYNLNQPLYRHSTEHGGIYCAACHDSPHAIAPSREPNDAIKFIAWQGHAGTLATCTVCHATEPTQAGPHGRSAPIPYSDRVYLPLVLYPN